MSVAAQSARREPVLIETGAAFADPHGIYAEARKKGDVAVNEIGIFIPLRHRHAGFVFDNSLTRQIEMEPMFLRGISEGPLFEIYRDAMLFANGETHLKRRQPMARTFAFKLMDGMRPRVAAIAAEIIMGSKGNGPINFLDDFSRAIPSRIIAEIVGAPPGDWPKFTKWVADAARGIAFFTPEELPAINDGVAKLNAYVARLLDVRRTRPREDFMTDYARVTAEEGKLTESEIRVQMAGVILAGSDTTRTGTASILSQLLQHPEQWALVCADPDRWKKAAVEEGLRFDPPVGSVGRVALKDLDIDGVMIPEGRVVSISLVSALRDPDVYPDPDRFDIRRTGLPRWNIAFGHGAHRCLGEALARAEMEEAIATIARLAPKTRIIGKPPTITGHVAIRSIDAMTVEFA
ncbi:MAG TPA: cytochrome P450 [Parvularcula sp.]|nr:cytochrome P450 [Parvularcula sp.]HBS34516.1 cytochrome P450 [Parvularcula sp.]